MFSTWVQLLTVSNVKGSQGERPANCLSMVCWYQLTTMTVIYCELWKARREDLKTCQHEVG